MQHYNEVSCSEASYQGLDATIQKWTETHARYEIEILFLLLIKYGQKSVSFGGHDHYLKELTCSTC